MLGVFSLQTPKIQYAFIIIAPFDRKNGKTRGFGRCPDIKELRDEVGSEMKLLGNQVVDLRDRVSKVEGLLEGIQTSLHHALTGQREAA